MFQVLFEFFFGIALLRERLQLDSRNDLTTNGMILGFFVENGSIRWLHIYMAWNLQEMHNC